MMPSRRGKVLSALFLRILVYLTRKGIDVSKYKPSIRFNPDKIQLIPKNPVIPGCIKIKAEGECPNSRVKFPRGDDREADQESDSRDRDEGWWHTRPLQSYPPL